MSLNTPRESGLTSMLRPQQENDWGDEPDEEVGGVKCCFFNVIIRLYYMQYSLINKHPPCFQNNLAHCCYGCLECSSSENGNFFVLVDFRLLCFLVFFFVSEIFQYPPILFNPAGHMGRLGRKQGCQSHSKQVGGAGPNTDQLLFLTAK